MFSRSGTEMMRDFGRPLNTTTFDLPAAILAEWHHLSKEERLNLKSIRMFAIVAGAAAVALVGSAIVQAGPTEPDPQWGIHDEKRPKPPVVTPGTVPTEGQAAPADAVVLFDG